jgi:hypothetical protein
LSQLRQNPERLPVVALPPTENPTASSPVSNQRARDRSVSNLSQREPSGPSSLSPQRSEAPAAVPVAPEVAMERAPALHARSFSLDGDTVGPPNFNYAAHPAVPRPPEAADPAPVFANAHGLTNASAMAAPAAVEPAVPAPTVAAPADQLDRPEVCDRPPLPAPAKVSMKAPGTFHSFFHGFYEIFVA